MKVLKYLAYSLALCFMIASCDKHEILYNTEPAQDAEFQLHYFEPIVNKAANYIDSVFVNGVLYSSVNGSGQLLPYNGVPGGATGRFFSVKSGEVNFKFYRKDKVVYDQNCTLVAGKQNVVVHDLTKAPVVLDNGYPYQHTTEWVPGVSEYGTDSLATVKFCNFLYEKPGEPYAGKLQYQWEHPRTKEWHNLGAPVAFGQATERVAITIVKTVHNSSGYCRINYRILDENGELLKVRNSGGKMVNYGDYWNGYIGRSYMHFFRGNRAATPTCAVSQWTSL